MIHALPASAVPAPRALPQPAAWFARSFLAAAVLAAGAAGALATGTWAAHAAIANAGPELTHLLRGMALLKSTFAGAALAVTLWRLAAPVGWPRLLAYAAAGSATAAGPGRIWSMAHVQAGALLLHGGLLATALLLWRDPAMAARLQAAIAVRRARLRARDIL